MKVENMIKNKAQRESMKSYKTKACYKRRHKNKVGKAVIKRKLRTIQRVYRNTSKHSGRLGCVIWIMAIILFITLFIFGNCGKDKDWGYSYIPENEINHSTNLYPTSCDLALEDAVYYIKSGLSKEDIYEQLTSEYGSGYAKEAAQYAIDNLEQGMKDYNRLEEK